jgi:hypothetical protein
MLVAQQLRWRAWWLAHPRGMTVALLPHLLVLRRHRCSLVGGAAVRMSPLVLVRHRHTTEHGVAIRQHDKPSTDATDLVTGFVGFGAVWTGNKDEHQKSCHEDMPANAVV